GRPRCPNELWILVRGGYDEAFKRPAHYLGECDRFGKQCCRGTELSQLLLYNVPGQRQQPGACSLWPSSESKLKCADNITCGWHILKFSATGSTRSGPLSLAFFLVEFQHPRNCQGAALGGGASACSGNRHDFGLSRWANAAGCGRGASRIWDSGDDSSVSWSG